MPGIPPHFAHSEMYFATRAPSQQTVVFASTATGSGVSSAYTTNIGDQNPLFPLMEANDARADGWVTFSIPSNLPDETNLLIGSAKLNVTNPTAKIASIYLAARRDRTWGNWAPELQSMAAPGDGAREASILFIPVQDRTYDLQWWVSAPANATVADGMTCSINISLAGFGVNW